MRGNSGRYAWRMGACSLVLPAMLLVAGCGGGARPPVARNPELKPLQDRIPLLETFESSTVRVTLEYGGDACVQPGKPRSVKLTLHNLTHGPRAFPVNVNAMPPGWLVSSLPGEPTILDPGTEDTVEPTFTASPGRAGEIVHIGIDVGGLEKTIDLRLIIQN